MTRGAEEQEARLAASGALQAPWTRGSDWRPSRVSRARSALPGRVRRSRGAGGRRSRLLGTRLNAAQARRNDLMYEEVGGARALRLPWGRGQRARPSRRGPGERGW